MPPRPRTAPSKKLPKALPFAPIVLWWRGLAAMGDERWSDAITNLKLFLPYTVGVDRAATYQNLGASYFELGLYDDTVSVLEEARKLVPNDLDFLILQGMAYACHGKIKEAILHFETYQRRVPSRSRLHNIRERLQLMRQIERGEVPKNTYRYELLLEYIRQNLEFNDFHLVERKAQELISLLPDRPEGLFYLGLAYLETGRVQESIETFKAATVQAPQHDVTRYNLAYALIKDGRVEEAISHLELALRYNPQYVQAMHEMGIACLRLGRQAEAIQWWKKALKIEPGYRPTQSRLHEVGEGPAPKDLPLTSKQVQLRAMIPSAKQHIPQPTIVKQASWTVTYQLGQGFVLEDAQNPYNITLYLGKPFLVKVIADADFLNFMGVLKYTLWQMNADNTRDVAILAYYANGDLFNYQVNYQTGHKDDQIVEGRLHPGEVPLCFKLRIDTDFQLPYVNASQGYIIYLNQHPQPGFWITSMVD